MNMLNTFNFTETQQAAYDQCTDLQRKTVINLVKGNMSQRSAYYKAGGRAKTDKSADVAVSTMLGNVKAKAFYNSLIEAAVTEAVMNRNRILERLTEFAELKPDGTEPATNVFKINMMAIKQITEMQGWKSAKQMEHKVEVAEMSDLERARRIAYVLTKCSQELT